MIGAASRGENKYFYILSLLEIGWIKHDFSSACQILLGKKNQCPGGIQDRSFYFHHGWCWSKSGLGEYGFSSMVGRFISTTLHSVNGAVSCVSSTLYFSKAHAAVWYMSTQEETRVLILVAINNGLNGLTTAHRVHFMFGARSKGQRLASQFRLPYIHPVLLWIVLFPASDYNSDLGV